MKRAVLVFASAAAERTGDRVLRGVSAKAGRAKQAGKDRRIDARALCLKLDRFVQGNREALALVRVPTEEEEQARALHRQREQLVKARKAIGSPGAQSNGQSRD